MHLPEADKNDVVNFVTKDWIEMSSKKEKKRNPASEDDPVEEEEDETNYNSQRQLHKENVDHLITIREVPSSYLCWSVVSTLCCCFSCFRYGLVENIN